MKRAGIFCAAVLLAFGAGWVVDWYKAPKERTIYRDVPGPVVLVDSEPEIRTAPLPECPTIAVLAPTPKEREELDEAFAGLALPRDLLTLKDVDPAPYGGRLVVGLPEPRPDGSERPVEVVFLPNEQPFFEWLGARELSLYAGIGDGMAPAGMAELGMDLVRLGPAVVKTKAVVIGGQEGFHYGVFAGVGVRF